METEIFKANDSYVKNWISLNPNLKGFNYKNNILICPDGKEINFKNFLVSELLNNQYFKNNVYTLSSKEFITIIKLHVYSDYILNDLIYTSRSESSITNNEYIKNVKINSKGYATIITSENNVYEIEDVPANEVLMTYTLLFSQTNYLPLNELLKNIHKENTKDENIDDFSNSILNIKFFYLINSSLPLNSKESEYIVSKSKFIYYLLINQDLLTGCAQHLLDLYNIELNRIASLKNPNISQQLALHSYKKNLADFDNYKKEQEKKEVIKPLKVSNGYTSLFIILTSIIVTGFFLLILYFA